MYAFNKRFSGGYEDLERWTIRLDGFVSQHAGAREERLVTKPFVFAGEKMLLNFATSARGHVKLLLRTLDGDEMAETCELFGNACDRRVTFTKGTQQKRTIWRTASTRRGKSAPSPRCPAGRWCWRCGCRKRMCTR